MWGVALTAWLLLVTLTAALCRMAKRLDDPRHDGVKRLRLVRGRRDHAGS